MARRDLSGAVDFDHLLAYAGGDKALVEEVLSMFEHQSELWMRLLEPEGDPQAFRDAAHTLKGASLGVGAGALAEVCSQAEASAGPDPGLRSVLRDKIRFELDRALADLAAWRHEEALRSLKT